MTNAEIAKVFQDIADRLARNKENIFKIRAYQKAVRFITEFPEPLERLVAEGRLKEIDGVGEAIAKKITELTTTGKLAFYERLKAEVKADSKNEAQNTNSPPLVKGD